MRIFGFAMLMLVSYSVLGAATIAQCSNPMGKAYYPYLGMVDKNKSGWKDDGITAGLVSLQKDDDGSYDLLFVDSMKRILSAKGDGGQVLLFSKGERDASFLVVYPGITAEIYMFLTNKDGKSEYVYLQSRGGKQARIAKAALFRGDCDFLRHEMLN
jgi:hypothetical protein